MAAVLMRLRAEARGRWRTWLALALALMIGLAAGASIAAAAGARRATTDPTIAVVGTGFGGEGAVYRIGDAVTTEGAAVDSVKGVLAPTLIEGRAPTGSGEIALGRKTMQAAGVTLGGTVEVSFQGVDVVRRLRVVGMVVLPLDGDISTVGDGVWITTAAARALAAEIPPIADTAFIRFAPGVDKNDARERLADRFAEVIGISTPAPVLEFGRISDLMVVMAGVLAALAGGTLAHMLTTSIRRRRRDLAILRTLGFSGRQVGSTVGWQAVVFVSAALAIAIPVGVIVGRSAWNLIARYQGFATVTVVPPLAFAIVAAGALAAALVIAALPARAAARSRPALVLRAE